MKISLTEIALKIILARWIWTHESLLNRSSYFQYRTCDLSLDYSNSGANPTSVIYNVMNILVRFANKCIFFYLKNSLAYYVQRWLCSWKFRNHKIGTWILSSKRTLPALLEITTQKVA
jgi:hypothetical protein